MTVVSFLLALTQMHVQTPREEESAGPEPEGQMSEVTDLQGQTSKPTDVQGQTSEVIDTQRGTSESTNVQGQTSESNDAGDTDEQQQMSVSHEDSDARGPTSEPNKVPADTEKV